MVVVIVVDDDDVVVVVRKSFSCSRSKFSLFTGCAFLPFTAVQAPRIL